MYTSVHLPNLPQLSGGGKGNYNKVVNVTNHLVILYMNIHVYHP